MLIVIFVVLCIMFVWFGFVDFWEGCFDILYIKLKFFKIFIFCVCVVELCNVVVRVWGLVFCVVILCFVEEDWKLYREWIGCVNFFCVGSVWIERVCCRCVFWKLGEFSYCGWYFVVCRSFCKEGELLGSLCDVDWVFLELLVFGCW